MREKHAAAGASGLSGSARVVGVTAAMGVALLLLLPALADALVGTPAENEFAEAREVGAAGGPYRVVYIGYVPESFDPARPWSEERVVDAAMAWWRAHLMDRLVDAQAVEVQGQVIGYRVTYVPEGHIPAQALGGEALPRLGERFDMIQRSA